MAIKTKKILVPLDGSKNSIRGLDMAIHLARQSQGVIVGLSVKSVPGIYAIHPLGFLDFNTSKEMKKTLDDAKLRAAKKGITAKSFLKEGRSIVSEIEKIAKSEKCDLVIVGNKGLGPITVFLLGSVSNKLAHYSNCSLLIVK